MHLKSCLHPNHNARTRVKLTFSDTDLEIFSFMGPPASNANEYISGERKLNQQV